MGKWNSKEIVMQAEKDFEKAWLETASLLPTGGRHPSQKPGKPHVLFETVQALRDAYQKLGFEEVINPIFIEDQEIKKQFGSEAAAVLDRCYYLGGLPRPDVGLSDEKIAELKKFGVNVKREQIQAIMHDYKKGKFGGDDLIYRLAGVLGADDAVAAKVINEVFPEFRALKPLSSSTTLRSHMTSGWFLTLQELIKRKPMPIKLFSVDRCFRREQAEDKTHLRTHHSASCIVAGDDAGVEDGKEVAEGLLANFGFKEFKFKLDEKRSKYYAPGTQMEVYGRNKKVGWVELATFGVYSPVALSRYGIEVPVMNLGLGVERLAMVLHDSTDVRELVYPQFYASWAMSDNEIASMLSFAKMPESDDGRKLSDSILKAAEKYGGEKSPCAFSVYSGRLLGKNVEVKISEKEEGKKLLGPAAFNEIYVYKSSIYGVPAKEFEEIRKNGVYASMRYVDGIANLAAHEIESAALSGKKTSVTRVPMVRNLNDINVKLDDAAMRYITTNSKTIDIRGPVFMTVEASVS